MPKCVAFTYLNPHKMKLLLTALKKPENESPLTMTHISYFLNKMKIRMKENEGGCFDFFVPSPFFVCLRELGC